MKTLFILVLSLMYPLFVSAQVKQKFKIADLSFMSGSWTTTSDWGQMDEFWSSPNGDCMVSAFRCVKDGKIVFYEFLVIEQRVNDTVPVLKLRHFNPGSIGWEDKDKPYLYPLTSLTGQKAIFERPDKNTIITYERISNDTLKSVLIQETPEKQKVTEFVYTRSEK